MSDVIDYKENLIACGIQKDLIPDELSPDQYQSLYFNVQDASLWITERWQLLALAGDERGYSDLSVIDGQGANLSFYAALAGSIKWLDYVLAQRPALLFTMNKGGKSLAHYAVLSEKPDGLNWINQNTPALLIEKDKGGYTIAHNAVRFGKIKNLDWIKQNKCELLTMEDVRGYTLAHRAVLLGNLTILEWIKQNDPQLLTVLDQSGWTLVHHAITAGNEEILDWLEQYDPHLLTIKADNDWTIEILAAFTGKAALFNRALALTGNRHCVDFTLVNSTPFKNRCIPTLQAALQTNGMLTDIKGLDAEAMSELKPLLDANKKKIQDELKAIIRRFTLLLYETNAENERCLPQDILQTLFIAAVESVTDRLSTKRIEAQFKKMVTNTETYKAGYQHTKQHLQGPSFFHCQRRDFNQAASDMEKSTQDGVNRPL